MRFAVVDSNDVVVNVIEAPADFTLEGFRLVASEIAGPDDTFDGANFTPAVRPEVSLPIATVPEHTHSAASSLGGVAGVAGAVQPKWQYNTDTREYCLVGADGLKLFAISRDASGNAVFTMFDTAGTPVVPGWLDLTRTGTSQSGIITGTDIIMNGSRGAGIPYNPSTGVVTLKAGKVYRLFATFGLFTIEQGDSVEIEWVKALDNEVLAADHMTRIRPMTTTYKGNSANPIEVIYTPSADTDVKLRCTLYTHATDSVTMNLSRSMATVVELS